MGRRKLEMKRIEDKSSRQVTFSKRRGGLFNKARQLSGLCDADIAVVIFSARGKLYEFCSGGSSVGHIISRYEKSCFEAEVKTTIGVGEAMIQGFHSQCTRFRTCEELLKTMKKFVEEPKAEELSVTDLTQLEEEIQVALMQIRSRKTQLMMEYVSTLHDKERMLTEDNKEMEKQVGLGKQNVAGNDDSGRLNDLATNQINLPQLSTLPLFTR